MNNPVLILYLEDDPRDAELVRDKLRQTTSPACELRVARGRAEYEAALAQTRFDLILSDYSLPDFDGMAALALARSKQPDVPFILISGTLGEEQAVDCLVRGATDYLLKERLERLVPAVLRALTDAEEHQKRRESEEALKDSEMRMRLATEATGVGIWEWNVPTNRIRWDAQMFRIYGIDPTPDGFVDYSVWTGAVLPEDLHEQEAALQEMVRQLGRSAREFRIRRFHECRRIQSVETALLNARGQAEWVVGTNLDITERKRAEEALRQQNVELQRFNKATVGRELQMVELKQQINELCRHLGQPPRHPLDFLGAKPQPAAAAETVEPKGASSTEADLSEGPDFKANQTNVPSGAPRRAGR
jgi:PAS domain S-box-containing protein